MDERARGLILRTRPLTETSLIVHWLTTDLGRVATVAKGARRSKSPFRGKLDLFYLADLSFQRSRRSDLHQLREISLLETHPALRSDLDYVHQASYCSTLLEQTTETDTPLPGLFELLQGFLRHLTNQPPRALTVFAFEMKLLDELGLLPDLTETSVPPGTRVILEKLPKTDWPTLARIRLSAQQNGQIKSFLHNFIVYHLGGIPKGRAQAVQSLADCQK